jgi:Tfp pilus assembly protein PilF
LTYAALSISYSDFAHGSILGSKEFKPKAEAVASKALELDERLAEAHAALALLKSNGWEWAAAEQEYQRAVELNPNLAIAFCGYAFHLGLVGRHEQANAEVKRARDLDPLSPVVTTRSCSFWALIRRSTRCAQTRASPI